VRQNLTTDITGFVHTPKLELGYVQIYLWLKDIVMLFEKDKKYPPCSLHPQALGQCEAAIPPKAQQKKKAPTLPDLREAQSVDDGDLNVVGRHGLSVQIANPTLDLRCQSLPGIRLTVTTSRPRSSSKRPLPCFPLFRKSFLTNQVSSVCFPGSTFLAIIGKREQRNPQEDFY
jgi:hypothetical protein